LVGILEKKNEREIFKSKESKIIIVTIVNKLFTQFRKLNDSSDALKRRLFRD